MHEQPSQETIRQADPQDLNAQESKFSGAIVHKPRNTRSIDFHERLRFRLDFEATPADGMPRGIYTLEKNKTTGPFPR